jgi:hypothetical protein
MIHSHKSLFRNYIRQLLGDPDKLLFNDDELDGYIERYTDSTPVNTSVTCYSLKWKLNIACGGAYPVSHISLVSGYHANGAYLIDELGGAIYFDKANPLNTAPDPADGSQINVSYWLVQVPPLMSELFMVLSSNHTKLAASQSIAGTSIDTTQLAKQFYNTAVRWRCEGCG